MRFCDLFISYKIGLKGIKSSISFTKLPKYRKIFIIVTFIITVFAATLYFLGKPVASCIALGLLLLWIGIFGIIDSKKRNLEVMLNEHYIPYSKERMKMVIKVLKKYEIDIHNSDSIDMLIEEAKYAQVQCDYLLPLKKPIKTIGGIIIPIGVYVARKIGDTASQDNMIMMAVDVIIIILLFFSLAFAISSLVKEVLYRDYNKYDQLIYDLRQIKVFYSKKKKDNV